MTLAGCDDWLESEQTPFPGAGFISFVSNWAANFGCKRFRIIPDVISKLLRAAMWSSCAVRFESEQMPFPQAGHPLRSATLHKIQFWICGFVPMSYFYSETNEWSKDWAKLRVLLWSATTSRQFNKKIYLTWQKKWFVTIRYLQSNKTFWLLKWDSITRVVARFLHASLLLPAATAAD